MLETSNEVDEGRVTKEDNISLSRYPTASFPSDIVETFDNHDILLIIEAEETQQKNTTGYLKDDVFLFNDEIQSKNDEQIEKNKVAGKYEKNCS